jgi:hypothetical protein
MNGLDDLRGAASDDLATRAPRDPLLADRVRARARRGRLTRAAVGAVGAVALAAAVPVLAAHVGGGSTGPVVAQASPCRSTVVTGVLPVWARGGFSDPKPVMPYVASASGEIVAILWQPLTGPPASPGGDKVLWVWRTPADTTAVRAFARLDGTGPALREFATDVTGPSGVSLPSAGCWRITITWPTGSDTIDLQAAQP